MELSKWMRFIGNTSSNLFIHYIKVLSNCLIGIRFLMCKFAQRLGLCYVGE